MTSNSAGQGIVGLLDPGPGLRLIGDILVHVHITHRPAVDDYLGAGVAAGLEQHGIHAHVRVQPAGLGLDHLGPAHLTAIPGDERIQGHVLGLKGGHPVPVLQQDPAEGRRQDAFAGIGAGPLEHEGRGFGAFDRDDFLIGQDSLQGLGQPLVFRLRSHRHPEIAVIQTLVIAANPYSYPLDQQPAGQFGGV